MGGPTPGAFGRSFEERALAVGVPTLTSREMMLLLQGVRVLADRQWAQ